MTFAGDIVFSLVALIILFWFFERANALAFRSYIMWGSLLGLILYLRLLSRFSVRFYSLIFRTMTHLATLIHRGIKIPIRGLVLIMRPFYIMLRWLSLLLYRIGEVIFLKTAINTKRRIKGWWNGLLPPKTNG